MFGIKYLRKKGKQLLLIKNRNTHTIMKHNIIITILLLATITSNCNSETTNNIPNSTPRLAVIITINGLQNYQIESFLPSLERGGIRRIINSGLYSTTAQTSYMPSDYVCDYASLMSGSSPRYHGIISSNFYSLLDDNIVSCISDARYDGINSTQTISPRLLQATTITDQIKLKSSKSKIYSIALSPEAAVMLGGHLADGAIWLDDKSGKIATTTYYNKGLPQWVNHINNDNTIENYCNTPWQSAFDINTYQYPPTQPSSTNEPCFDKPNQNTDINEKIKYLKRTPFINEIIKELAIRAIRDEQMGTDNNVDLLAIEFSANSKYSNTPFSAENEDMLMCIDRNIKTLLDIIDISVGLENCVIVLTSPTYINNSLNNTANKKLNQGIFNSYKATALLNSYLMAIYGQGRWVTAYNNKNINLNKSLIEDNKIKKEEIENYVSQFMLEFAGVHSAITSNQIQTTSSLPNDYPSRIRNSHYKNRSGDVIFTLMPGWQECDRNEKIIGHAMPAQSLIPVAIWMPGIKFQSTTIMYEDICPTLCHILQIPIPNATIGNIINLK